MEAKDIDSTPGRPFILAIFCIALFVYTATLSLIFLFATIFNRWISNIVVDFFPDRNINSTNLLLLSATGFLLNTLSFYAVYSVWKLKRSGLYILMITSLLFLMLPFSLGFGNYYSVIIIFVLNGLLFLFYRKLK